MTIRTDQLFESKRPPTQRSTHGSQRPRSMAGRKPLCNLLNNSMHASINYMKRVWPRPWSASKSTYSDNFRCSNVLASMGLSSFCPWCLKLGGTPKQLPSILERCIIGWQLYMTYASHLLDWMHRASWTTILGIKSSMTRNMQNRRDRKRWRSHTRRSPSPGNERRHPHYSAWRSPKDHKSRMPLNTFCLVQPENVSWFTSWIFLDHHSFISWVILLSIRQTVTSFFSPNVYDAMVLMLTILYYVSVVLLFQLVVNVYTFIQSFCFMC